MVYSSRFSNKERAIGELTKIIQKLYERGYASASIDSLYIDSLTVRAYVYKGERFRWSYVNNGNIDAYIFKGIAFNPKKIAKQPFVYTYIEELKRQIVIKYENTGYPFAQVFLGRFCINDNKLGASLFVEKNKYYTIDSFQIEGTKRIRANFLSSYLGLKIGSPYSERLVESIAQKIRGLSYIRERKPAIVVFDDTGHTQIKLFLERQRASRFNLLLGFVPRSTENNAFLFTGEADIHLVNPFGTGKEIWLQWQLTRAKTQRLDIGFLYPYVLSKPIGLDLGFDFYKRDTSYLDLNWDIGLQYHFDSKHYIKAFYKGVRTNTINIDTTFIIQNERLHGVLDLDGARYGVQYFFDDRNTLFAPIKGRYISIDLGVGFRRIRRNIVIQELINPETGLRFDKLYDDFPLRQIRYQMHGIFARLWPIKRKSAFLTKLQAGAIIGQHLSQNELYRVGGALLLRGIDEEAILTPFYGVFTLSYRYILADRAIFSTFFDLGVVQDRRPHSKPVDVPFGFGLGVSLKTKGGIFSLNYALGRQLDQAINFQRSKIHFGYINYF